MKKTLIRVTAVVVICAMAASASGCYFFPEEEKLLDPPVLKVEDVTYSTYKAVKASISLKMPLICTLSIEIGYSGMPADVRQKKKYCPY
jgi:hypothetical protein